MLFFTAAAALLPSCSSTRDPYAGSSYAHFERYEPSLVELARMRQGNGLDNPITVSQGGYTVADIDVVNYADHVKSILRTKFTNARFARYTSASAQVGLAAASGLAAAFSAGTAAIATLAFSSAAVPQFGEIFNAKARATVYQQAVSNIEEAEAAYFANHSTPSRDRFTSDGMTLYQNVTGNIHTVEKAIAGEVPDLKSVHDSTTTPKPSRKPATITRGE